ncbi:MAG: hypothetical protein QM736_20670 [Vicinamibacterales bacterium]
MRFLLTCHPLALVARSARSRLASVVRLGLCACACVVACTQGVRAGSLTGHVPIAGGTAALSRALGIDPVPDPARFFTELVHVIYDAPEGKSTSSDRLRTQLEAHLDAIDRFRTALAAVQPAGSGISLSHAKDKHEREQLQRFLNVVGLQLAVKKTGVSVARASSKEAEARLPFLAELGFDRERLMEQLNGGGSVRVDVPADMVPLPLPAHLWGDVVFQRPITSDGLFSAIVHDRSAALLCYGLAALDDETLRYLTEQPTLLRNLYERNAAVFAAFGGSLRVRANAVVVPGGPDAVPLWEGVLGESPAHPERFIRELFSRREGRIAYIYDAATQLDAERRAFLLGQWIPDAERRLDRFRSFLKTLQAFPGWGVPVRPFSRPPDDPIVMLTRIVTDDRGVPLAPSRQAFWSEVFDSVDIPTEPARRLSNVERSGAIDAAWLADALLSAPTQHRAERLDQLAFGQRAFAGISDGMLPDALVAVRAFPRYRMLVLTFERMGARTPAVYAAAVRHAERLAVLDATRAPVALSQYQGALALLARMARVHHLDVAQEEALIASLSAVPVTDDGYAGGVARWMRRELMPLLADAGTDVDAAILQSVSGPRKSDAEQRLVSWEEREYVLDIVTPETRRISRVLQKLRAASVRQALELESVASLLARSDLNERDIDTANAALTMLLPSVSSTIAERAGRAIVDLPKMSRTAGLSKAQEIARSLQSVADEMLASALRAWAYAIDLGDQNGGRVIAGDISRRHDFGLTEQDTDRRLRQAWAEPEQIVQPSVPWHVAGSLLGLERGLSQTLLRRVSSDALPRPPRLLAADRELFARTVSSMDVVDVADRDMDAIADAVDAGRMRVARLGVSPHDVDAVADEIAMDGWRRRALRWTLRNAPADTLSYFSLNELLHLGQQRSNAPRADEAIAVASDGCLCRQLPVPGRWTVMVGRSRGGQIAAQVADLNLRMLLALKELKLPAALVRGVLAAATQDYIDNVSPLYPDDWLTLVRSAQAVPIDRVADYVATMTADGTLAPITSQPRER